MFIMLMKPIKFSLQNLLKFCVTLKTLNYNKIIFLKDIIIKTVVNENFIIHYNATI